MLYHQLVSKKPPDPDNAAGFRHCRPERQKYAWQIRYSDQDCDNADQSSLAQIAAFAAKDKPIAAMPIVIIRVSFMHPSHFDNFYRRKYSADKN